MDWNEDLILLWLANKSKINEIRFYWNLILELMIDLLFFIRSRLEGYHILHRHVNSYIGTLLWTTIILLDGSQFTFMIC